MKLLKIALPVCCVFAAALMLAACRQEPPVPGPADPNAEEYSVASKIQAQYNAAVEEVRALQDDTGVVVRGVTNETGLQTVLAGDERRPIRLEGNDFEGTVTIAEADYSDRDFIFDAPNADVTVEATVGTVTVRQANENGCTLNAHAKTVFVNGGELNVTLKGGADKVYISGRNAKVVLESGDYPVIYCDNITDVIANKTKNTLTLILPNGSTTDIPGGKMYVMESGDLKSAR